MDTQESIHELRRMLLSSTDRAAVGDLSQKIAGRGDVVIAELEPLLSDSSTAVREGAADVLELIGTSAAYDKLVDFALRHLKDPSQQTKVPGPGWQRLRHAGKPVLAAMTARYDSSLPFDTRLAMIFIAQQIGDPAARPLLERALVESDPRLVEAAAEALGVVDGPGALERLVQLLQSNEEHFRAGAVRGLKLLGDQAAVRQLFEALASSDQTVSHWGASSGVPSSMRDLILNAIDSLAGESFNGDTNRIREWLERHP